MKSSELDIFDRFFAVFRKGDNLCVCAHQNPSEKGSTLKGKNLPRGANSSLLK